ncbi:hypothetical protein ACHQM5_011215 [Ranunculus cassubicifolius]
MGSLEEQTPETSCSKPHGIRFVEYIKNSTISFKTHQAIVIVVTFFAYASYHATRKTTSIVKSSLDPESTELGSSFHFFYWPRKLTLKENGGKGWAPFNGPDGSSTLGEIDLAFLSVYAMGMYISGHLGDRLDLRVFLTIGMIGTGLFTLLFGFGYWLNIHSFYYFLVVQMLAGLFQSTGWPSVVAVIGNWFGKKKRGLIMGLWNSHTSVGNISGSLIAAALLRYGWGWSFAIPGLLIIIFGILVFLLLPVSPESVGVEQGDDALVNSPKECSKEITFTEPLLKKKDVIKEQPVGFLEAWRIPGVAPYALCLFFAKLVAYTFLYWLPFYISHTAIDGVVGGILAGHISDHLDARAITAASFMYCAIPALFLYRSYGHVSLCVNVVLMFVTGMFVNGPYALITTAVSTDLGTHSSLNGNSRALATVTAIIDGTGSVGAALGPLLTGYISTESWTGVFSMLMAAALVAGLLLTRLVVAEVTSKIDGVRSQSHAISRSSSGDHQV